MQEPLLWLIISIIAIIVTSVKLYSHFIANSSFSGGWFKALYILVVVALCILVFLLFSNNHYRPSRVDVSPIEELSAEQMERLEDALMQLYYIEFINGPSITEYRDFEHPSLLRSYGFSWVDNQGRYSTPPTLIVSVDILRREERAVEWIQSTRIRNEMQNIPYIDVINENGTEAVLRHSFMPIRASALYLPTSDRRIITEIRIGNAHIRLNETRSWHNLNDDFSSQFIYMLVELMQGD